MWTGPKLQVQVQEEAQCKEGDDSESKVLGVIPKACYREPRTEGWTGPPASSLGLKHSEPQVCSRNYLEDLTGPPARDTIRSVHP